MNTKGAARGIRHGVSVHIRHGRNDGIVDDIGHIREQLWFNLCSKKKERKKKKKRKKKKESENGE